MRDWLPLPMLSRYAVDALTPCTSRNWSESAPVTRPDCQLVPPSIVRTHVPCDPPSQTTCSLTGLTAMRSAFVPLVCSVARIRAGLMSFGDGAAQAHASAAMTMNPGLRFVIACRRRERSAVPTTEAHRHPPDS